VPIRSFKDVGTSHIARQARSKAARKILPVNLHESALEKLVLLDAATRLNDLAIWPSLRLEKLRGNRAGQYSIRINDRFRICFKWSERGEASDVEIVDYH
jgi:proteic killer suppression protein